MKGKIGCLLGVAMVLIASQFTLGATKTFDFDGAEYGTANLDCQVNDPIPPMFNRPGYANQTSVYLVAPPGKCEGFFNSGTLGSTSLLSNGLSSSNYDEIHFSWVNPADDASWARIATYPAGPSGAQVVPISINPTIYIGDGASVQMSIELLATDGDITDETVIPLGELEFSLAIRETGLNLPLGADGGNDESKKVEFVGVDSATTATMPIGGTALVGEPDLYTVTFHTIKWTFRDTSEPPDNVIEAVDVSVDGDTPVRKGIAGFSGNGLLSADYNRAVLNSLAIRKPTTDTTSKKWYVVVDDVVIDAPGVTDPVEVVGPILVVDSTVTVRNIDPTATAVYLLKNHAAFEGPFNPGGATSYDFTNLSLTAGDIITATQTVDGDTSDESAPVTVTNGVLLQDNFDSYATTAAMNAVWPVTGTTTEPERITLSSITGASCPKSALEPGSSGGATYLRAQIQQVIPGAPTLGGYQGSDERPLVLTVWMLHDQGTANRNWIEFNGRAGHNGTGSYLTRCRLGMYNSPPAVTNRYQCTTFAGYAITWENLDAGPEGAVATRLPKVWNKFRIRVKTNTVEYEVNDVVYRVDPRPDPAHTFDSVIIGSGYTNSGLAAFWDNISVSLGDADPFGATPPLPMPAVNPPVQEGATSVTVSSIDPNATLVTVYVNGTARGSATLASPAPATKAVTITALADKDLVQATQTIDGVESCKSYGRATVFAQGVGKLRIAMGIREQPGISGGPIGNTCTATASGNIEWIGSTATVTSPPIGKLITPGPNWQTLTFWATGFGGTDPIKNAFGVGNGVIVSNWAVLEHLAISIDTAAPMPGPYALYVDNIENNGVIIANGWEDGAVGSYMVFRQPTLSSTTSGMLSTPPNASTISTDTAYAGSKSDKIQWAWKDISVGNWLRLTTAGTTASLFYSPIIDLNSPVTIRFKLCAAAGVDIGGILVPGAESVTVTGIDTSADTVTVYANGSPIGSAPTGGATSVDVPVTALVAGQSIAATQTIGGSEGCTGTAKEVGGCEQVPNVTVGGPLIPGTTDVTVLGVDPTANPVKVYVNGVQHGSAPASGSDTVVVTLDTTLATGDSVQATQTMIGTESCIEAAVAAVVGSNTNSGILLTLGIRENTALTGPVGADGGSTGTSIQFLGASSKIGTAPQGKLITPSSSWQTVTFYPAAFGEIPADPVLSMTGGDTVLDGTFGVLEHLAISSTGTDTGPYKLYIDNVTSGGTTFGTFEASAAGDQAMFQPPGYSGTTSANLLDYPYVSLVDGTKGDGSAKSARLEWQFLDLSTTRWARVTTFGDANMDALPNPEVDLTQPITLRVLLLPACEAPTVTGISPNTGVQGTGNRTANPPGPSTPLYTVAPGPVHATITGAGFVAGATVKLVQSGKADLVATNVVVVDPATITADIDLGGVNDPAFPPGSLDGAWDVVVTTCAAGTLPGGFTVSMCFSPRVDTDGDGSIDLAVDFTIFRSCFNGVRPFNGPPIDQRKCSCLDADPVGAPNGTVDLLDFAKFRNCFNGPNRAPAPGCSS